MLLTAGADVNAWDDRALYYAAYWGHTETVKVLLASGANVHADHDMALHWAAQNGHTETVKVLQEAIKSQNTQRLELERQQNPLYAGTGLIFAKSRPEDVEALLRDAVAEQIAVERPDRREHVPLPLCP
jgi:ankyrin repeat protein